MGSSHSAGKFTGSRRHLLLSVMAFARAAGRYQMHKRKLTLPALLGGERDNLLWPSCTSLRNLSARPTPKRLLRRWRAALPALPSILPLLSPGGSQQIPAAGVSKNAQTGSAKVVSQNAPTDFAGAATEARSWLVTCRLALRQPPSPPSGRRVRSERRANNCQGRCGSASAWPPRHAARAKREEGHSCAAPAPPCRGWQREVVLPAAACGPLAPQYWMVYALLR